MPVAGKPATFARTGEVRCSYVHLDQPWSNDPDGVKKYQMTIMVPKSDTRTIKALRDAQEAAKQIGKDKGTWGGGVPSKLKDTIHDGDDPQDVDLDRNPEFAGHWILAVGNTRRPAVVDTDLQEITEASELYSGMYCRVSLNAFPYNNKGGKGISLGLQNVQKLRDGEPLGMTVSSAADDFGDDDLL